MPVITVYQHGHSCGTPPMLNSHPRALRQDCSGWSAKTSRSNTRFLQSVSLDGLTGHGYAFTLTVKDCPASHEDWAKLRDKYIKRLTRLGMIRLHWVTEWQRRGVPHLHGVAYFSNADCSIGNEIVSSWVSASAKYRSAIHAQTAKPVSDSLGWLQYLAKHAARGANHYQRSGDNIPEGWKKTGRMWGKSGSWSVREPMRFNLDREGGFVYRRLIRSYRVSEARSSDNPSSVKYPRRMLKCNIRKLSEVRGTASWVPESTSLQMLAFIASSGYGIEQ